MSMCLERHPRCEKCELHLGCKNVGLPMLRYHWPEDPPTNTDLALVVVGSYPGVEEDAAGEPFAGPTGSILKEVYLHWLRQHLDSLPEVYLVNALRCMPPREYNATATDIRACRDYLEADLASLRLQYTTVVLLLVGKPACMYQGWSTLDEGLSHQGYEREDGIRVFISHQPATLLASMDPSKVHAIQDHLWLLVNYLNENTLPEAIVTRVYEKNPQEGPRYARMVSLDLETYGCVEGLPVQRCFNPVKCVALDGVAREDLIQTAAAAWRDEEDHLLAAFWDRHHLEELTQWLSDLRDCYLLASNVQFDIRMLRYATPQLHELLSRRHRSTTGVRLMDMAVGNFLQADTRTEKGLKDVSFVLQVSSFREEQSLKKGFRYETADDPNLERYNILDATSTLRVWEELHKRVRLGYPRSIRFTPECLLWHGKTIEVALAMSEAGVAMSPEKLEALREQNERMAERIAGWMDKRHGGKPGGKGSTAVIRDLVEAALEESHLVGDRRVRYLKSGKVSTDREMMNLLLDSLPLGAKTRGPIRMIGRFRSCRNLVDHFIKPLSTPGSPLQLVDGVAFPSWYVVPSVMENLNGRVGKGGTRQGRMTCHGPPVQTYPHLVKTCMTSRFRPGIFLGADLSQIELRIAALLSGDTRMMGAYRRGLDIHAETTKVLFPDLEPGTPEFRRMRQVGKQVNFLMLYRGRENMLQATLREKAATELGLGECRRIIGKFFDGYPELYNWQERQIEEACRLGRLELPLTGDVRTLGGSSRMIRKAYTKVICNFPVQTIAANVMKAAQFEILTELDAQSLQTLMVLNIYDAVYLDLPASEEEKVLNLIRGPLTCPKYYRDLQSLMEREVPLDYDVSILARTGIDSTE